MLPAEVLPGHHLPNSSVPSPAHLLTLPGASLVASQVTGLLGAGSVSWGRMEVQSPGGG
jgi:hypothetical protein